MKALKSCIYEGTVVHKRLFPRAHGFSYRVFSLCLDVDEIDTIDRTLRLFSRNRRNVMSIRDGDLGAGGTESIGDKVRGVLAASGLSQSAARIELVCYPRLFGYAFNPLSVYFCRDDAGTLGAVIYEVTNTFGERKAYVIPSDGQDGAISQSCAKELYVSPFTAAEGRYGFHAVPPCDRIVIGVNFRENDRPVLKTHFRGVRRPLSDAGIAGLIVRYPLMTAKVIAAIHFEAARLWAKRIPLAERRTSPSYSFTLVDHPSRNAHHV